jgi:hypothetical protein
MTNIIMIVTILLTVNCYAQTNAHLPLKTYSFDFVSVNTKDSLNSPYNETGQFTGIGEINVFSDSITVNWSNEWECGIYRLFVDTATYQEYDYDGRSEWLSHYTVRSKGYHSVDGLLTLVEGTDIKEGRYTDIIFDTIFTPDGWAMNRRMYLNITKLE